MKIIYEKINDFNDIELNEETLIFDIETTGFNHKYSIIIMISYIYKDNNDLILEQHYSNNSNDEKLLLIEFIKKINKRPFLIHFNGLSFDIPFINAKINLHNLFFQYNKNLSFDLYNKIKKENKPSKLKDIEKLYNYKRTDLISGKEIVELYKVYKKTKDKKILDDILLHNKEDVISCLNILYMDQDIHNLLNSKLLFLNNNYFKITKITFSKNVRIEISNIKDTLVKEYKIFRINNIILFNIGDKFDLLSNKEKNNLILFNGKSILYNNIKNYIK